MTTTCTTYALLLSFLATNCFGSTNIGESQTVKIEKNERVLNLNELFDVSKVDATQILKSFSSPFEVKGQIRVIRGFSASPQYIILQPCSEDYRFKRLGEEFKNLSEEEHRTWFEESQRVGKFGWDIHGKLSKNISISEVVVGEGNEELLLIKYSLLDKINEMEIIENQCATFFVEHLEKPIKIEFPIAPPIGQILIVGIKDEAN